MISEERERRRREGANRDSKNAKSDRVLNRDATEGKRRDVPKKSEESAGDKVANTEQFRLKGVCGRRGFLREILDALEHDDRGLFRNSSENSDEENPLSKVFERV